MKGWFGVRTYRGLGISGPSMPRILERLERTPPPSSAAAHTPAAGVAADADAWPKKTPPVDPSENEPVKREPTRQRLHKRASVHQRFESMKEEHGSSGRIKRQVPKDAGMSLETKRLGCMKSPETSGFSFFVRCRRLTPREEKSGIERRKKNHPQKDPLAPSVFGSDRRPRLSDIGPGRFDACADGWGRSRRARCIVSRGASPTCVRARQQ